MKLESWSVVRSCLSPYQAPEQWLQHLHGKVSGHLRFPDETEVTTSAIVKVVEDKVHTASGSIYELGEVDPAYEAAFPNARERLLARGAS